MRGPNEKMLSSCVMGNEIQDSGSPVLLTVWYFPHIKIGLSCVLVPSSEFRCKQVGGSADVLIKEGALENGFVRRLSFLLFLYTVIVQDNSNASPTCRFVLLCAQVVLLFSFQPSNRIPLCNPLFIPPRTLISQSDIITDK